MRAHACADARRERARADQGPNSYWTQARVKTVVKMQEAPSFDAAQMATNLVDNWNQEHPGGRDGLLAVYQNLNLYRIGRGQQHGKTDKNKNMEVMKGLLGMDVKTQNDPHSGRCVRARASCLAVSAVGGKVSVRSLCSTCSHNRSTPKTTTNRRSHILDFPGRRQRRRVVHRYADEKATLPTYCKYGSTRCSYKGSLKTSVSDAAGGARTFKVRPRVFVWRPSMPRVLLHTHAPRTWSVAPEPFASPHAHCA